MDVFDIVKEISPAEAVVLFIATELLTAFTAYYFGLAKARGEILMREESERRLYTGRKMFDKKRSLEEKLLRLIDDAAMAVQETYGLQNFLPDIGEEERQRIIHDGFKKVDALRRFVKI
jgi:hypothetical protein